MSTTREVIEVAKEMRLLASRLGGSSTQLISWATRLEALAPQGDLAPVAAVLIDCRQKIEAYQSAYGLKYVGGKEASALLRDIDRALIATPAKVEDTTNPHRIIIAGEWQTFPNKAAALQARAEFDAPLPRDEDFRPEPISFATPASKVEGYCMNCHRPKSGPYRPVELCGCATLRYTRTDPPAHGGGS